MLNKIMLDTFYLTAKETNISIVEGYGAQAEQILEQKFSGERNENK